MPLTWMIRLRKLLIHELQRRQEDEGCGIGVLGFSFTAVKQTSPGEYPWGSSQVINVRPPAFSEILPQYSSKRARQLVNCFLLTEYLVAI